MEFETEHTFLNRCRIKRMWIGGVLCAMKACYEERERYILLYGVSPEYVCIGNGMVYLFFDPYFSSSVVAKIRVITCGYPAVPYPGYCANADLIVYGGGFETSSTHLICLTHETALKIMDQFPT